ncbi:MAG TPA: phosphotransferase [Planococcus sp. (in: firmicutes)]|nr:phosphotransferase [Planococcus sp. (in: firmicutes)]
MKAKELIEKFGFQIEEEPVSIYPFSPVYRVKGMESDFIVKKTQFPIDKADRLMNYTKSLKERGIDVVVPSALEAQNPITIDGATYVVYPFIAGHPYSGRDYEIKDAGRLLGKIHSFSPLTNEIGLDPYGVYDFNEDEVIDSFQNIVVNAAPFGLDIPATMEARLLQAVHQQELLKMSGLPHVATPHDYKANNLIYTPQPYLIDPDNAAWVPRIFDLALVLLLFHNELATAPDQPFTVKQWELFLEGYRESVGLTQQEKDYWTNAVEHVFLDEVMWLMADVAEDWQNPEQRNLFEQLIHILGNLEEYRVS